MDSRNVKTWNPMIITIARKVILYSRKNICLNAGTVARMDAVIVPMDLIKPKVGLIRRNDKKQLLKSYQLLVIGY